MMGEVKYYYTREPDVGSIENLLKNIFTDLLGPVEYQDSQISQFMIQASF